MASIINRARTKEYILEKIKQERPGWKCQRVSRKALDQIESYMKMQINKSISYHPSKGMTFLNFD